MLRGAAIGFTLVCAASGVTAQSYQWTPLGGDQDVAIVGSSSGGDRFGVSGFSINQVGLELELLSAVDVIRQAFPDVSQDYFAIDAQGNRISVKPTVAQVWEIVSRQSDVLGLVPVGYSETAGSGEIAGFYRIKGESYNSIFSAPNMDTVICFDDHARANHESQDFDVPFLFEANIGPRYSYSYEETVEAVELDHLSEKDRWRQTFDACQDMIQAGFRLVEPRHIMDDNGRSGRRVERLNVDLTVPTFALTAMMFDRGARFNFVRFGDVTPVTAARILSSQEFQRGSCPRRVRGAENCEIWATMLTAFDDAASFVRPTAQDAPKVFGQPDVIAPAVLVLRDRSAGVGRLSPLPSLPAPPVAD